MTATDSDDDAADEGMAATLVVVAAAVRGKSRAPPGGFPDKGAGCSKCEMKGCRWCPR